TATTDLWARLKSGSSVGATRRFSTLRRALIVSQVTLSMILLVGSGLMLRSLRNSYRADLGYRTDSLLVASINFRGQGYTEARAVAFERELLVRIEAVAGVRSASMARMAPVEYFTWTQDIDAGGRRFTVGKNLVAPNYFRTLDIAMIAGRDFTSHDQQGTQAVAILNHALRER